MPPPGDSFGISVGRMFRIAIWGLETETFQAFPTPEAFFNTANRTFCPTEIPKESPGGGITASEGHFRSPLVTLRTAYPVEFSPV